MKQLLFGFILALLIAFSLSACGNAPDSTDELQQPQISPATLENSPSKQDTEISQTEPEPIISNTDSNLVENIDESEEMLMIQIGDTTLTAALEDNPSVDALKELLADDSITIDVQNYGGFEKVGALPQTLPRNDVQTTANPGDVMLYQGNSLVFFYGSNAWDYTKIGTITDLSQDELSEILSGSDSIIKLSLANLDKDN